MCPLYFDETMLNEYMFMTRCLHLMSFDLMMSSHVYNFICFIIVFAMPYVVVMSSVCVIPSYVHSMCHDNLHHMSCRPSSTPFHDFTYGFSWLQCHTMCHNFGVMTCHDFSVMTYVICSVLYQYFRVRSWFVMQQHVTIVVMPCVMDSLLYTVSWWECHGICHDFISCHVSWIPCDAQYCLVYHNVCVMNVINVHTLFHDWIF